MSVSAAFTPTGNTVTFTANVSGSVPTPVQVPTAGGLGSNQYRIVNTSSNITVFLGVSTTSSGATTNAVVVSTTAPSIPVFAASVEVLTLPPNAYFTGITASGTAAVYITPGDGL